MKSLQEQPNLSSFSKILKPNIARLHDRCSDLTREMSTLETQLAVSTRQLNKQRDHLLEVCLFPARFFSISLTNNALAPIPSSLSLSLAQFFNLLFSFSFSLTHSLLLSLSLVFYLLAVFHPFTFF